MHEFLRVYIIFLRSLWVYYFMSIWKIFVMIFFLLIILSVDA